MKFLSTWGIFASLGFILFLPFPYFLLGFWTDISKAIFNPICEGILGVISPNTTYFGIESDSAGMWVWICLIVVISTILSSVLYSRINLKNTLKWHRVIITYFLSFILLKYGLDKVLLNQFYFPEPNILYTRVGAMDKSLLYWSSMGSSPTYSIFSGIIEIIPGILLLFRRTRAFAGLVATLVFINILALNLGFNIDVKLLSFSLFVMSLYIAWPFLILVKRIIVSPNQFTRLEFTERLFKDYKWYTGIKILVIFFMTIEVIGPVIMKSENEVLENMKGTYLVEVYGEHFNQVPKYIHIHSKGYLIIEYYNDFMEDYKLRIGENQLQIERNSEVLVLNYIIAENTLVLSNSDEEKSLFFRGRKLNNELLPLNQNSFQLVAF